MLPSGAWFPSIVNLCLAAGLLAGGARLFWLFLSPVPKANEVVQRRKFLTLGRFAPLLVILGSAAVAGFAIVALWLKSAPHGWWNIFPYLTAYALGILGAGALLMGIAVQSVLVDINRGLDVEAGTGNLQRNLDAAFVFAFGIIMLAALGYRWMPELDWSTATLADIERQKFAIRGPFYLAAFAAVIRTHYSVRGDAWKAGKVLGRFATWAGVLFFIALNQIVDGLLPHDYDVKEYLRDRNDPIALLGIETPLSPPPDMWHGELVALIGLVLVMTMSAMTCLDMLARRGVSSIYIPQRSWPGIVFACLALAATALFAKHDLPPDVTVDWIAEVAVPLTIGMALVRAFPALWAFGGWGWRAAAKTAAHGLLTQILLLLLLAPAAAILLYAASLLTRTGFAVLLLGGIAAAALGWLRIPATTATADAVPVATQ